MIYIGMCFTENVPDSYARNSIGYLFNGINGLVLLVLNVILLISAIKVIISFCRKRFYK